jgi:hypothetical protein
MDDAVVEVRLRRAQRHVAEGEKRVRDQRARVDYLQRYGHDTVTAKQILVLLEQTQLLHVTLHDQLVERPARVSSPRAGAQRQQDERKTDRHELGNIMVAAHFCLQRLRGRQVSDELEGVVRNAIDLCESGMRAFRRLK